MKRRSRLDADYALAYAELAIATLFLGNYGGLTLTEAIARATPHVEKAMTLDSTLAETHAAAGYVFRFQDKVEEAMTHFRQAVKINPNYSLVFNGIGVLLDDYIGNYEEAFAAYQTALRLDPLLIRLQSTI